MPCSFAMSENDDSLPPGIVLLEGEVWIPASSDDPMPLEDDGTIPMGYKYIGKISGNATFEIFVSGGIQGIGTGALLARIPAYTSGSFTIPAIVVDLVAVAGFGLSVLEYYSTPKNERGNYTKYIYECKDPGIYPYIYYYFFEYWIPISDGKSTRDVYHTRGVYDYALLP